MPNTLNSVLANISGLAGYEAARLGNQQQSNTDLGMLVKLHAMAREEALKREALQAGTADRAATRDMTAAQREATLAFQREAQAQRTADAAASRAQRMAEIEARLRSAETMAKDKAALMRELAKLRADSVQRPVRTQAVTDERGNIRVINLDTGAVVSTIPSAGKPSESFVKREEAKKKGAIQLDEAITNLEAATKPGGLIDRATGSGIGAAIDMAGRAVGYATPGGIAIGQLAPIFDLALKMVPRFEGPQSDKDTQSYKEAAGQLSNPNIPAPQKKAAAKEILRLMKARRGQFTTADAPAETGGGIPDGMDPAVWGAMTPEERALFQ